MKTILYPAFAILCALTLWSGCSTPRSYSPEGSGPTLSSCEIIDLGAVVTEDLPERFWGKAFMHQMGFGQQNLFDVLDREFRAGERTIPISNSYYTLFNHGGPHVDAPNHVGERGGIDAYGVDSFCGPVKVFDVRHLSPGRSVPLEIFRGHVQRGDIVLIYTGYTPPQSDDETPEVRTLTNKAAEYLATLPVRAYGTDSFSVECLEETQLPWIHQVFLSRAIPVYEQLVNMDQLLGRTNLFFVGAPLNIKEGDGMMVRPVVFVH